MGTLVFILWLELEFLLGTHESPVLNKKHSISKDFIECIMDLCID